MKKIAYLIAVIATLAVLGGVAGTLAWFTDMETASNVMTTGNVKIAIYENGEKITKHTEARIDQGCVPGQRIDKRVKVANEGISQAYVRVSIKNEGGLVISELGRRWAEYHGYYYYTTILEAGTETSELITYVGIPTQWSGTEELKDLEVVIYAQAIQSANQGLVDPLNPALEELETIFGGTEILPAEPESESESPAESESESESPADPEQADEYKQVMEWFQEQLETPGSTVAVLFGKAADGIDSTGPNFATEITKELSETGILTGESDYSWQMRRESDGSCTIYWVQDGNVKHNETGDVVSARQYNTNTGFSEGTREMIVFSKIVADSGNRGHIVNYLVPYDPDLEYETGILWLAEHMVSNETLNQYFGTAGVRTMDSSGANFGKPVSAALAAETGLSSDEFLWKITKPAADTACDYYWADVRPEECQAGQWVPAVSYNAYTGKLRTGQCQITADGSSKKLGAFRADEKEE